MENIVITVQNKVQKYNYGAVSFISTAT